MSPVRFVVSLIVTAVVVVVVGCSDPCVVLAERICNCEATANERRACIADRITNQQSNTEIDQTDRTFCEERLEDCTCAALDRNDPDNKCGFANEAE